MYVMKKLFKEGARATKSPRSTGWIPARRLLAFTLALMVGVTFIPLLSGPAFAQTDADADPQVEVEVDSDLDVDVDADLDAAPGDADVDVDADLSAEPGDADVDADPGDAGSEPEDITLTEEPELAEPSEPVSSEFDPGEMLGVPAMTDAPAGLKAAAETGVPAGAYTVRIAGTGKGFTIEGSIGSTYTKKPYYYVFGKLYVDGVELKDFTGTTSIAKQTISLSSFNTGYHTVFLQLYNKNSGSLVRMIYKEKISNNMITDKPTYKGVFDVYAKKFNFYPYNMAMSNQAGPLYMEYKLKKAKTWKRTGAMKANAIDLYPTQGFVIKGLKANKNYQTRLRYGTYVTYAKLLYSDFGLSLEQFQTYFNTTRTYLGDGKTYFFGGPVLNSRTIKTGKAKKPKIKSVKVKAVKIKYHKNKVPGHYEWVGNSLIWIGPYTEKFYTCKLKVTIKLKKKPGTKGIYVNGKYLKGNKKTYTTTFTPYPNYYTKRPPKGIKFKVTIRSYQNKAYGGWSPKYSKTKKAK